MPIKRLVTTSIQLKSNQYIFLNKVITRRRLKEDNRNIDEPYIRHTRCAQTP